MPRPIIDVESSRPAYVRRRVRSVALVTAVLAVLLALGVMIVASRTPTKPSSGPAPAGTASQAPLHPGTSVP
ncbi:MAG: hypothetical protein ACYDA5_06645 [Vulcanimicrobiaceae bacterium]